MVFLCFGPDSIYSGYSLIVPHQLTPSLNTDDSTLESSSKISLSDLGRAGVGHAPSLNIDESNIESSSQIFLVGFGEGRVGR
jgi:hypothetical protein